MDPCVQRNSSRSGRKYCKKWGNIFLEAAISWLSWCLLQAVTSVSRRNLGYQVIYHATEDLKQNLLVRIIIGIRFIGTNTFLGKRTGWRSLCFLNWRSSSHLMLASSHMRCERSETMQTMRMFMYVVCLRTYMKIHMNLTTLFHG